MTRPTRPRPTILDRLQVAGLDAEIVAEFRRRAQERGEMATRGGDRGNQFTGGKVAEDDIATLPAVGVTRDDAHRKRRECGCALCQPYGPPLTGGTATPEVAP